MSQARPFLVVDTACLGGKPSCGMGRLTVFGDALMRISAFLGRPPDSVEATVVPRTCLNPVPELEVIASDCQSL